MSTKMNERDRWSAPERAWRIACQNYQLLAMLEVLHEHSADDAAHLALATRLTLAFPEDTSRSDRELPIDVGARTREVLAAAHAKATMLCEAVTAEDAQLQGNLLHVMAEACARLGDWIALHDRSFEQLDAPGQPESSG
ncbi:MAG: hypothetical protein EOO22_25770, partial [Comamonadaceae bacterium]